MKKIFITGAGSGLGKEAAIELARRGHTVYATVYYQDQLKPLEEIARSEKIDLKILNKLSNTDITVSLIEPGAYATGFNKENSEKKYLWMDNFSPYLDIIHKYEEKMWRFLEQKSFTSIIKKYVSAVEDSNPHFRYYAPWWQAFLVQIGRIIGM